VKSLRGIVVLDYWYAGPARGAVPAPFVLPRGSVDGCRPALRELPPEGGGVGGPEGAVLTAVRCWVQSVSFARVLVCIWRERVFGLLFLPIPSTPWVREGIPVVYAPVSPGNAGSIYTNHPGMPQNMFCLSFVGLCIHLRSLVFIRIRIRSYLLCLAGELDLLMLHSVR
jgi:hypothetical protein